jgi:hypothetical protein
MGDVKKLKKLLDIGLSNLERLSKEKNELLSKSKEGRKENS